MAGTDYSLKELVATIISPLNVNAINYNNLAKHELASIYSMVNFYKVSKMWAYDYIEEIFNEYSGESYETYQKYTPKKAYRILSLESKKICCKIMFYFMVDDYYTNHLDEIDAENNL